MRYARPVACSLTVLLGALAAGAACTVPVAQQGTINQVGQQNTGGQDGGPGAPSADGGTAGPGNTGNPTGPTPVNPVTPPGDAAVACDMIYEAFTFDRAPDAGPEGGTAGPAVHGACDKCLTANCCEATVTCFNGNADCAALDACYVTCDKQYPQGSGGGGGGTGGGGGGGGGAGDGGGGDGGDAGVGPRRACFNTCDAAHPASTATYQVFSTCFMTTCKGTCIP